MAHKLEIQTDGKLDGEQLKAFSRILKRMLLERFPEMEGVEIWGQYNERGMLHWIAEPSPMETDEQTSMEISVVFAEAYAEYRRTLL